MKPIVTSLAFLALLLPHTAHAQRQRPCCLPSPIPESNVLGINSEDHFDQVVRPAEYFRGLRTKNVGWVRYWVHWDIVAPHPPASDSDYQWDIIDQELSNIKAAGLNIYLDLVWAPAWATQNIPGYVTWRCMTQSPPYVFTPGASNCGTDIKPDVGAWMNFVSAVVRRYSQPPYNVKYFGLWNEPNYEIFWHYNNHEFDGIVDEGWPKSASVSIAKEILVPGYQAVKSANPSAQVVGPESQSPLFLKWVLQEEGKYGRFLDVITFHIYVDGDGEHTVNELGPPDQSERYGKVLRDYGQDRPVWITETWPGDVNADRFWSGIRDRPWINKVFVYGPDNWTGPSVP